MSKPPLGVIPEYLWKEQRAKELLDAIKRYIDAGLPVLDEWQSELSNLIDWINNHNLGRMPKKGPTND